MPKPIKVGIIGLGTVGSAVCRLLKVHAGLLEQRVGAPIEVVRGIVRSKSSKRSWPLPASKISTRVEDLWNDPEISVVVELTGKVAESRAWALQAFQHGKHLVTANKALLALHGKEIFLAAQRAQVDVCFEAAVGGGIPILRALREGFVGNHLESLQGIVNGTCNYILTEMSQKQSGFDETLKLAQQLGYAEADPSFDVDGIDTAHKLAILLAIAYGVHVDLKKIHVEGIRPVTALDIECARRFGYAIKLLAIGKACGGKIQARVHPTMVPLQSMLAAVSGVHNAILVRGDFVGEGMLYGRGAGGDPTASAVVSDIVEVARNLLANVAYTVPPLGIHHRNIRDAKIAAMDELKTSYYLRFQAIDRPGALAKIASILSRHHISISSVYQHIREEGKEVPIVVLTHEAVEKNIKKAIAEIDRLPDIPRPTTFIRMESDGQTAS